MENELIDIIGKFVFAIIGAWVLLSIFMIIRDEIRDAHNN